MCPRSQQFLWILNRVLDHPFHHVFGVWSVLLHRQELGVNTLDAKISHRRPAIVPSKPLNGQRLPPTMAREVRRSSLPIQDEELSRTDGEQQEVPSPQGSPPPPLADYGTVMQGIVQAIQTQAQTQAAFQTQVQAQVPAPAQQDRGLGGVSVMESFKRMAPPSFKGESEPLVVESCLWDIEKIFRAIRCAEDDKISLAAYMLQERADRQKRKMKKLMKRQQPTMVPIESTFQSVVLVGNEKPVCVHCGKRHGGDVCWTRLGRCLKCGGKDHRIKDCLNQKKRFIPRDVQVVRKPPKSVLASTWMDAHDMSASISTDANPNVAVHGCGRQYP
ncbi:hypothetical protein Taro_013422 [Colocasia esculenta]|uniref:CCHC-type domain-containing protein n=1 Tax=Colocasia esculenta TaxID=4460 RepID=A0A843UG58_COLES|nr:hypothetical protein [Colocasia esculenta]